MRKRVIKVRADQVRRGQVVTDIAHGRIHRQGGWWPTVTAIEYRERGEDGGPMVYIELSDRPGAVFPLHPDETVTVLADGFLAGATGSGKSRWLDQVAIEAVARDGVVVVVDECWALLPDAFAAAWEVTG